MYNSIIILGPTASGKTKLAAHLALAKNGAVLSFDSRQVYRQLNIGSGKDLEEFTIANNTIPSYLINICDVDTNFHSYEFVKNFITAFEQCTDKKLLPILCGGTGLYFDLVLKKYQNINIPVNAMFRENLMALPKELLIMKLNSYPNEYMLHADTSTNKRIIRAIEIADYLLKNKHEEISYPELRPLIFGIRLSQEERRMKIQLRLKNRLENGLLEEVQNLLISGVSSTRLEFLGLEYKFVTEFLMGKYNKETMIIRLETAINQYAKRQMTWFRKMEKEGNDIRWIDGKDSFTEQLDFILNNL